MMTDATAHVGRILLVTGGGSGIGAASCLGLAGAGAHVGVLDQSAETAQATMQQIGAAGGSAEAICADVTDDAAMKAAIGGFAERHGSLDGVVACAGINGVWAPVDDLQPEEFDRTVAVNLRGTFLALHYSVPFLKKSGGAIVIVASINGVRTFSSAGAIAYAATKAGQLAMANQLALELARYRIRVNTVCPGWTRTDIGKASTTRNQDEARYPVDYALGQVPLTGGVPARPDAISDAVVFLMSDAARHISGTPLFVDGAESILT